MERELQSTYSSEWPRARVGEGARQEPWHGCPTPLCCLFASFALSVSKIAEDLQHTEEG